MEKSVQKRSSTASLRLREKPPGACFFGFRPSGFFRPSAFGFRIWPAPPASAEDPANSPLQQPPQFPPNLLEPAAIRLSLFVQAAGYFRREPHLRFSQL